MKTDIVLRINSISDTKKQIDEKYSELISMIDKYKEMINDTKNVYDTESANLYRTIADAYIDLVKKYLNTDFKPFVDKLDEVKDIYLREYNTIFESIQGGQQ